MTIDVLPDEILVEIFFYVNYRHDDWEFVQDKWYALVHVCQRWRYLVFASPCRLNLRLQYEGHGPISEVLGDWPVLPVALISSRDPFPVPNPDQRWDNRVAALESEHYNRICEIRIFNMINSHWDRFAAAMQKPFPELTHLQVFRNLDDDMVSPLPDSFLGGSAPRLQTLSLEGIPLPSIQKLLLSANRLVTLDLDLGGIPDTGYISPDAMATALTAMTGLESLLLRLLSPPSRPYPASRPLPPPTRFVLSCLTQFMFQGVYEYLEDLLARIDPPLLYTLCINFSINFNFDIPQLHRLICHTEEFKAFDHAKVLVLSYAIRLTLCPKTRKVDHPRLVLQIICRESDQQLSSLARVCGSSFPFISTLEEVDIEADGYLISSHWKDNMESAQWVGLLDPFTALKSLYLNHGIAQRVCGALQEHPVERAAEVLPALRNLFIQGSRTLELVQEAMIPFVAARQLSGHPVAIDLWRR